MRRANYTVLQVDLDRILLQDIGPWDEYPTVTNDVRLVVRDMAHLYGRALAGRKLYYIDSDGRTDRIVVRNGRFAGFEPANEEVI